MTVVNLRCPLEHGYQYKNVRFYLFNKYIINDRRIDVLGVNELIFQLIQLIYYFF